MIDQLRLRRTANNGFFVIVGDDPYVSGEEFAFTDGADLVDWLAGQLGVDTARQQFAIPLIGRVGERVESEAAPSNEEIDAAGVTTAVTTGADDGQATRMAERRTAAMEPYGRDEIKADAVAPCGSVIDRTGRLADLVRLMGGDRKWVRLTLSEIKDGLSCSEPTATKTVRDCEDAGLVVTARVRHGAGIGRWLAIAPEHGGRAGEFVPPGAASGEDAAGAPAQEPDEADEGTGPEGSEADVAATRPEVGPVDSALSRSAISSEPLAAISEDEKDEMMGVLVDLSRKLQASVFEITARALAEKTGIFIGRVPQVLAALQRDRLVTVRLSPMGGQVVTVLEDDA